MARGRPSRAAARRSTPVRSATPQQDTDDDMVDAPVSRADTPKEEEDDAESAAPEADEEEDSQQVGSQILTCLLTCVLALLSFAL